MAPNSQKLHRKLIEATVLVKKAACLTNVEAGNLGDKIGQAIAQAADEVLAGQWHEQFVVDLFLPGASTAHNSNSNEVLANRALEILEAQPGAYTIIHPDRHVNLAQSESGVFSTAMRISLLTALKEFEAIMLDLERLLRRRSLEFERVLKSGRALVPAATTITFGPELQDYGASVERSSQRLKATTGSLLDISPGAATETQDLSPAATHSARVVERLSQLTGFPFRLAERSSQATQSAADLLEVSSSLKRLAVELLMIAGDLRLRSPGERAGPAETNLPGLTFSPSGVVCQALPDRANQMIAESLTAAAFQVIGNDTTVTLAAQAGHSHSSIFAPLIIHNLLWSLDLLSQGILTFNRRYLSGLAIGASIAEKQEQPGSKQTAALEKAAPEDRRALSVPASLTGKLYEEF